MPAPRLFAIGFLVVGVLGCAAWWLTQASTATAPTVAKPSSAPATPGEQRHGAAPTASANSPAAVIAAVPAAVAAKPTVDGRTAHPPAVSPPPRESAPPVPAGPTAAALADAHRTGANADATSPLLAAEPFDEATFANDPAPYLQRSVPGRVFQTAAPGPGVPVLGARGPATHEIPHGGSCDLTVRAPAGAAVTFTTFDLGLFDNGLASITVQASPDGIATAHFRAVGEVVGDVHLLAGSPMASGQVKFLVAVLPPADRLPQTN